jgi:hypothetical protein
MSEWVADTAEAAAKHSFKHCLDASYAYGPFDAAHHAAVLRGLLPTPGGGKGGPRVDLQLPRHSMYSMHSFRGTMQAQHGGAVNYGVAAKLVRGLRNSEVGLCSEFEMPRLDILP